MAGGATDNAMIGSAIKRLCEAQGSLQIVGRSSLPGETVIWGLDSEAVRACDDVRNRIGALIEQLARCLQADSLGKLKPMP